MGLNTKNAGGLVAGEQAAAQGASERIVMLKGTFIASVGRDTQADEIVTVSKDDGLFLRAYKYARLATPDDEKPAAADEKPAADDSKSKDK